MSKRRFLNNISYIFRNIRSWSKVMARKLRRSLLRLWMAINRRGRYSRAGFVLPTVTMVMLVVVLLSIAILLRSFDRADMARNVKVNQQVLSAAAPALERASAKIDYLLNEDPTLPKGTPSDDLLHTTMTTDNYTFGDETPLKVRFDINNNGNFDEFGEGESANNDPILENNEQIETAWRYPVDTDNNGSFDSYTIYGIFFRSPTRDTESGEFNRERKPLEARTPPQPPFDSLGNPQCAGATGTSSSLVGDSGWFKSGSKLRKSFFVYTTTVPITNKNQNGLISAKDIKKFKADKFEDYKGRAGFSGLEYQQDYERVSLANNAVVYESDLEAAPGFEFNINGRILTNSNLMLTHFNAFNVYQVSGRSSCFYEAESSKILVGGELINGRTRKDDANPNPVTVHLFQGKDANPITAEIKNGDTESVSNSPLAAAYNEQAYRQRIAAMVDAIIATPANYPPKVTETVVDLVADGTSEDIARQETLQAYFKERTRKVPFAEVALDVDGTGGKTGTDTIQGSGESLRPIDEWMLPTGGTATQADATSNGSLSLVLGKPPATDPDTIVNDVEKYLGDRILVGNNLPALRYDESEDPPRFVGVAKGQQVDDKTTWTDSEEPRWRKTQVQELADVGNPDRNGFWELAAAQEPESAVDGYGGLRVITGAGVYDRKNSFLPPPKVDVYDDPATTATETFPIVWPDTMPMSPVAGSKVYDNAASAAPYWVDFDTATKTTATPTIDPSTGKYAKGDLRMRATAVYHYAKSSFEKGSTPSQAPIACVSSYYDPTSEETAKNFDATTAPNGKSNNGKVYGPPTYTAPGKSTEDSTTKLLGGTTPSILENQANLVFPDGRFVNEPLRTALLKDAGDRNLVDQAAIDATACALGILGTTGFTVGTTTVIPDGAIKELAFLNGREIKAIDADDSTTPNDETFTLSSNTTTPAKLSAKYTLSLEERQPLEIRVTQLDLDALRMTTIAFDTAQTDVGPDPEYLLPNSGIIYASRDDALPDRSDRTPDGTNGIDEGTSKLLSPTDSRLDPTRRPNGIMLVNGSKLNRNDTNTVTGSDSEKIESIVKEKGLILATNLPAYVQGNFNLHEHGEFTGATDINWNFAAYYNANKALDKNFACRGGDPRISGCDTGDTWRPATVISDSVTLLSGSFRPGYRNEGDFDLRNNTGTVVTQGYDLDGNKNISETTVKSEADLGIDLNGDGNAADTAVKVKETEVTTKLARTLNGFYTNNFVTNGLSSGVAINGNTKKDENYAENKDTPINSSYFNNFVTPIQRRGEFPEYLMEICLKLSVSACQPDDWVVIYDTGTIGTLEPTDIKKASELPTTPITLANLWSGTTAQAPKPEYQRYPRRVAFLRYINATTPNVPGTGWNKSKAAANVLVLQQDGSTWRPVPIGINGSEEISYYPYSANLTIGGKTYPFYAIGNIAVKSNALWFHTRDKGNEKIKSDSKFSLFVEKNLTSDAVKQPLTVPVLQIHATNNQAASTTDPFPTSGSNQVDETGWLPPATDTRFNLIMATGDVPSRVITSTEGETNGGLPNLPRFLENWKDKTAGISGSFIQLQRSAYATAPYQQVLPSSTPALFGKDPVNAKAPNKYNSPETDGYAPFFLPPTRTWNFDVGLLSQSPDLFALQLTGPTSDSEPDEYYREVSRDDEWVKTLLCSLTEDGNKAVNDDVRPDNFCVDE